MSYIVAFRSLASFILTFRSSLLSTLLRPRLYRIKTENWCTYSLSLITEQVILFYFRTFFHTVFILSFKIKTNNAETNVERMNRERGRELANEDGWKMKSHTFNSNANLISIWFGCADEFWTWMRAAALWWNVNPSTHNNSPNLYLQSWMNYYFWFFQELHLYPILGFTKMVKMRFVHIVYHTRNKLQRWFHDCWYFFLHRCLRFNSRSNRLGLIEQNLNASTSNSLYDAMSRHCIRVVPSYEMCTKHANVCA